MATPHIKAKFGDFAKTVLMPGDPNRAKWIAEKFLVEAKLVNDVRGILGYTGKTKSGKEISVMASGMGIPSICIYSHELFTYFGVEQIIRIGTCGINRSDLNLRDIIIAQGSSTDSNWQDQFNITGSLSALSDFDLLEKSVITARKMNLRYKVGNVFSSDVFYDESNLFDKYSKLGCLAVEMESYGLFVEAAKCNKKALTLLTATDSFCTNEHLTADERESSLTQMIELALQLA